MFRLTITLRRVQTFIFEVPRLKAMLGANALIGQVLRHELPRRLKCRGLSLTWPADLTLVEPSDPLDSVICKGDRDDPKALFADGVLARDGGHFIAVFPNEPAAEAFRAEAEEVLAKWLPGVLYDAPIREFEAMARLRDYCNEEDRAPRESQVMDLPVLQVCQETGQGPASWHRHDGWISDSVRHRLAWGDKENRRDIIGLMRSALYPSAMGKGPVDLDQLVAGGYLALIHADGNRVGSRYNVWRDRYQGTDPVAGEAYGEVFYHSMRVAVRTSLLKALRETFTGHYAVRPYEILMLGGDDLLLACRADKALDFALAYAQALKDLPLADGPPLDVAMGIAIAQAHYPFHRLHELAEELASSAKRLHRSVPKESPIRGHSVIDWQVVTQSWFSGVAAARARDERVIYTVGGKTETLLLTGRPYQVLPGPEGPPALKQLLQGVAKLDSGRPGNDDRDRAARSPLRALRDACEQGRLAGQMTFERYPARIRQILGESLWQEIGKDIHLTHALDIIGVREIAMLGKKRP